MMNAYGGLYNWHAVNNAEGLCPAGWHVPSNSEWAGLLNYLNLQAYPNTNVVNGAGNALKSCLQDNSPLGGDCAPYYEPYWESHNVHFGTDYFRFNGLPAGRLISDVSTNNFGYIREAGFWWSSSAEEEQASSYSIHYNQGQIINYPESDKNIGMSIRCIKDND